MVKRGRTGSWLHIYFFKNLWAAPIFFFPTLSAFYPHHFCISGRFVRRQRWSRLTKACTVSLFVPWPQAHKKKTKKPLNLWWWFSHYGAHLPRPLSPEPGRVSSLCYSFFQMLKSVSDALETLSSSTRPGHGEIRRWLRRCDRAWRVHAHQRAPKVLLGRAFSAVVPVRHAHRPLRPGTYLKCEFLKKLKRAKLFLVGHWRKKQSYYATCNKLLWVFFLHVCWYFLIKLYIFNHLLCKCFFRLAEDVSSVNYNSDLISLWWPSSLESASDQMFVFTHIPSPPHFSFHDSL